MRLGTLAITASKFRLPCVYEFKLNGLVLYVGRSDAGFSRAFDKRKSGGQLNDFGERIPRRNNRIEAFNMCDEIAVTVFDSTDEARDEEVARIGRLKPQYNIQHIKD